MRFKPMPTLHRTVYIGPNVIRYSTIDMTSRVKPEGAAFKGESKTNKRLEARWFMSSVHLCLSQVRLVRVS